MWRLDDQSFRVLEGRGSAIQTVAFSRDGSTLVSRDLGGWIRLWGVNGGRCLRESVKESIGAIFLGTLAPDGKTMASAGDLLDDKPEEHGLSAFGIFQMKTTSVPPPLSKRMMVQNIRWNIS